MLNVMSKKTRNQRIKIWPLTCNRHLDIQTSYGNVGPNQVQDLNFFIFILILHLSLLQTLTWLCHFISWFLTANSKWHRKSDNYLSVGGYLGGHKISESVRQTPTVAAN